MFRFFRLKIVIIIMRVSLDNFGLWISSFRDLFWILWSLRWISCDLGLDFRFRSDKLRLFSRLRLRFGCPRLGYITHLGRRIDYHRMRSLRSFLWFLSIFCACLSASEVICQLFLQCLTSSIFILRFLMFLCSWYYDFVIESY